MEKGCVYVEEERALTEYFIEALMNQIIESTMIPKVQVERVVGPLLGIFLEDILSATFPNNPEFSGKVKIISPEFPLKKTDSRQSTNIDWLMLNSECGRLYLVELKTSDTSVNRKQSEVYRSVKTRVETEGGGFLINDLEELRDASTESGKYQYLLQTKIQPYREGISSSHSVKIIYIVPDCAIEKIEGHADVVLSFSMLSQTISGPFSREWQIIQEYLSKLDTLSLQTRNRKSTKQKRNYTKTSNSRPKRWQGTLKFDEMVKFCQRHGNDIVIGFTGGRTKFASTPLLELQNRSHYKWDYANNMIGKNGADWLLGTTVLELLNLSHNLSQG